ncbi:MAG: flagellar biosynthetic protein FliO [Clostridia bacterium]|nr:flagellar biosynthetic protein FliO [Clostridia bacterium]
MSVSLLLQVAGALAVVVAVAYAALRALGRQPPWLGARGRVELVARVPLGPRSAVAVVRAGRGYFLLGVTEERVTLLSRLDADDWREGESSGG